MSAEAPPGGYWSSEDGITKRLEMLGETLVMDFFNNAVQVQASAFGINDYKMVGPGADDPKICPYCAQYVGRTYRLGQFMPHLPAHIHCRHFWDIHIRD